MELQFNKHDIDCLRTVADRQISQELTQEVRLLDGMPDIGRILGCWGQTVIRGKEWRGDEMSASGGVMAWVLYEPEDGSAPQILETWMPFQAKWDLQDAEHDGTMILRPALSCMDCRSTSARKIMLRCCLDLAAEGVEAMKLSLYQPDQVPEDVQLLQRTYPMEIPKEAGEKAFEIEDSWNISGLSDPQVRIVYYQVNPVLTEHKVMADKLVFRGNCLCNLLYIDGNGNLKSETTEFPVSQFVELSDTYGNHASATVDLLLTGMEIEKNETGTPEIKCGLAAQYKIFDREMITVVEDGYSTTRAADIENAMLQVPVRLDVRKDQIPYRHQIHANANRLVDTAVYWGNPAVQRTADGAEIVLDCFANVLYMDEEDRLSGTQSQWSDSRALSADDNTKVCARLTPEHHVALQDPEGAALSANMQMEVSVFSLQSIPMVIGMTLGEPQLKDEQRPSVILRKLGDKRIWELAKEHRTTVEAIEMANSITEQPDAESILLIPVP